VDDRVLSLGLRILVGVGMVAAGCGGPGLDLSTLTAVALAHGQAPADESSTWQIDTTSEWQAAASQSEGLTMSDGLLALTGKQGLYRSRLRRFKGKRAAHTMTLTASTAWNNWEPTQRKVVPPTLADAPIFLAKGPKDYWLFGRFKIPKGSQAENFAPARATLEGFDERLLTTPFPHLFDAPGGLQKSLGGYHAWQSRDMVNWVHHGPVTTEKGKWATTAEFVDGKTYLYYDFPNDQDPHLFIDDDLFDGKPGQDMGRVFHSPTDGSDCAVIRDMEGRFHLIYEDWSPIHAGKHSWDSPLAGHAVSDDGKGSFEILAAAVDQRTRPTGTFAEYAHPHWHAEDPTNFPGRKNPADIPNQRIKAGDTRAFATYEVHQPEQNAYGDWAAIAIGGQYYLVSDYHPAHENIRIGIFTSPSLNQPFEFIGELGSGHPDPDIGFAEGHFFLVNQTRHDYVSPGPWVEKVEARVGIDTTNDGMADTWSDWREVTEQYESIEGLAKQVKRIPASMDLSTLPEGYGFCFELRIEDTTANRSAPILDRVEICFQE